MLNKSTIVLILCFTILINTQVCPNSYFFNGQRCAPCKTNCQCTSEYGCDSCLSGYTYDALFQNCLQCPTANGLVNIGCKQCCYQVKGPGFVCSECAAGNSIFLMGGQCIQLIGCSDMSTDGLCTSCINGYFSSQGACISCHASCATCLDASLCLTCNIGYFSIPNLNYALCSACSNGCSSCSSSTVCTNCLSTYRLTGSTCTSCTSFCLNCTATACITCNSLSALISSLCYLCTDTSKQGSAGCLTCTSNPTRILCTSCSSGYFLNSVTNQCVACSTQYPNSVVCTSTKILQCANDNAPTLSTRYYLINNQCVANTKLCKTMSASNGDCSLCYFDSSTGYYSLISGTCTLCNVVGCLTYSSTCQCLSCVSGYQFINNQCIACQNLHCTVCQASISSCQQCAASYGRLSSACVLCTPSNCYNCDGDNTICVTCNVGYYLSNGNCYSCQTNCASCISNIQCTSCSPGTFLQANGRCKALPSNCISIDTSTISSNVGSCKRCSYGYILLDGNCYPCSSALLNLGICNSYHCPNYYAQLSWEVFTNLRNFMLVLCLLVISML